MNCSLKMVCSFSVSCIHFRLNSCTLYLAKRFFSRRYHGKVFLSNRSGNDWKNPKFSTHWKVQCSLFISMEFFRWNSQLWIMFEDAGHMWTIENMLMTFCCSHLGKNLIDFGNCLKAVTDSTIIDVYSISSHWN